MAVSAPTWATLMTGCAGPYCEQEHAECEAGFRVEQLALHLVSCERNGPAQASTASSLGSSRAQHTGVLKAAHEHCSGT